MLRCFVCCCVIGLTSCKTLKEADAAMSAWTREHLSEEEEKKQAEEGEAADGGKGATEQRDAGAPPPQQATADPNQQEQPPPMPTTDAARGAAAEALFESGHEAMSQGDYDTACARFEESNRLDPAVGSLLNLAACEEKRGRLATAWQLFKRVMNELPAGDDRYPIAQRRASDLRPRVPRLTLELERNAPKQTTVHYGKVILGQASFHVPLPFDPGEHTLYVVAPDRDRRAYQVTLREGEQKVLSVAPGAPKSTAH